MNILKKKGSVAAVKTSPDLVSKHSSGDLCSQLLTALSVGLITVVATVIVKITDPGLRDAVAIITLEVAWGTGPALCGNRDVKQ